MAKCKIRIGTHDLEIERSAKPTPTPAQERICKLWKVKVKTKFISLPSDLYMPMLIHYIKEKHYLKMVLKLRTPKIYEKITTFLLIIENRRKYISHTPYCNSKIHVDKIYAPIARQVNAQKYSLVTRALSWHFVWFTVVTLYLSNKSWRK